MATVAEAGGSAVAFTYRSIDRLILNAYIPTLQMPGAMVTFLREVCGKPILSPVVFQDVNGSVRGRRPGVYREAPHSRAPRDRTDEAATPAQPATLQVVK